MSAASVDECDTTERDSGFIDLNAPEDESIYISALAARSGGARYQAMVARRFFLALMASIAVAAASPDALLPPVETPTGVRVPDEYLITFKPPEEMARLPAGYADASSGVVRPSIMAEELPMDRAAAVKLAEALVRPLGGAVRETDQLQLTNQTVVRAHVPDENVHLLSKDPRITSVEPVRVDHAVPPPVSHRARIIC